LEISLTGRYIGTFPYYECIKCELCTTYIFLTRIVFSSVPRLPGWSFQQLIYGGVLPPPHCPDMSGPAVSPTDKLRKDSALRLGRARRGPPVTSEKPTLVIRVTKIVRLCKAQKCYQIIEMFLFSKSPLFFLKSWIIEHAYFFNHNKLTISGCLGHPLSLSFSVPSLSLVLGYESLQGFGRSVGHGSYIYARPILGTVSYHLGIPDTLAGFGNPYNYPLSIGDPPGAGESQSPSNDFAPPFLQVS